MKPPELFAAHYQRFKLNLIRRAHNALYELGLIDDLFGFSMNLLVNSKPTELFY